ncbi:DUF4363 family protein [Oscillospiraceae bacterium OttesenSCG-928-G22]|nr:DUF4363 family protein [Oscillospiraceae bacterium OttesenSCG-928-G22]
MKYFVSSVVVLALLWALTAANLSVLNDRISELDGLVAESLSLAETDGAFAAKDTIYRLTDTLEKNHIYFRLVLTHRDVDNLTELISRLRFSAEQGETVDFLAAGSSAREALHLLYHGELPLLENIL